MNDSSICISLLPSLTEITEDEKDSSLFDDFGTIPTPRK